MLSKVWRWWNELIEGCYVSVKRPLGHYIFGLMFMCPFYLWLEGRGLFLWLMLWGYFVVRADVWLNKKDTKDDIQRCVQCKEGKQAMQVIEHFAGEVVIDNLKETIRLFREKVSFLEMRIVELEVASEQSKL